MATISSAWQSAPLKTHLQMNLQTYQSYSSIRNAVQSYTEAKRTCRLDTAQSSNSSQIVANFTSGWIFAVTWADNLEEIYESEVEILLDSGAYDHVCGPEFAVHSPLLPRLDTGIVRNADGSEIPAHGRRRVRFRLEDGQTASVKFQFMNVKRCIFSIGRLVEQGFGVDFEKQILTGPDGRQARVHRQGRLYYLRAQLLESWQSTQVNPVWVDECGNEQEMNEHGESRVNSDTVGEPLDGQTAKGVREPRQPSEKERREHSLNHVPFRNWCKACVLSRSKENPHRPRTLYERKHQDKTTIQLDHMKWAYEKK